MKTAIIPLIVLFLISNNAISQIPDPPQNFQVEAENFDVLLSWEFPESTNDILGFNIYHNNIHIEFTEET
ncbi:MAG: hypothetical protein KC713_10855, partial [Candidatus Omnitrophica bacterium]|nr:hypothetical protein [Candidatus Omnitrophota bacterium]